MEDDSPTPHLPLVVCFIRTVNMTKITVVKFGEKSDTDLDIYVGGPLQDKKCIEIILIAV